VRVRWPLYNIPFIKTKFLLSKDTVLQGPLQALCGGTVDGLVKGYVTSTGTVVVGKSAEIKGDITASGAKVYGKVYGNIVCEEKVMVYNTAIIKGDITAKIIEVKEGALIEGVIIKLGDPNDERLHQAEESDITADNAEAVAEPVVVAPVRSGEGDKDASAWF